MSGFLSVSPARRDIQPDEISEILSRKQVLSKPEKRVSSPLRTHTGLGGPIEGVLTEYKIFPAHCPCALQNLVGIPKHLSYEKASTLPCAALTAYNGLMGPVPLKGDDIVLVQGTGGGSIFALQLAVASGVTVTATSSSDEKLKIAQKLGAKHLINCKKTPACQLGQRSASAGAYYVLPDPCSGPLTGRYVAFEYRRTVAALTTSSSAAARVHSGTA
ncbi:hypothetical protein CERSUDRAFT_70093 [Gelatoporia subvermispora B]|uniref:Alcohol dehydrogenase-like C-terminal domain-containing protein n=1 Tax=Ceriporiopsis subvermispora (strain B) TaxID=914234 RepID=M2RSZ2_CERS8|nr:hypothetical protein CERSUDRAFT_70093 [Gelatoporia subvermispora B]